MQRIYEPPAYGPASRQECFWPATVGRPAARPALEGAARAEFAVIGAGYTGLSAALHLARDHGADVAVLEAEEPGWGASGRNGGFCCLGGAKASHARLLARHGEADTAEYHRAERAAIDLVAELLARHCIRADTHSAGETILAHRPGAMAGLRREAEAMGRIHGVKPVLVPREELAAHGMDGPHFHGALTVPIGFALNPLKYALGLARAAEEAGARVFARSPVTAISREPGGGFRLTCAKGTLRARRLLLATNGYSSDDLPPWMAARYLPAQSNVIVTRPLKRAELAAQGWTTAQMAYDTRHLLHYFRLMPDGRFLFGMRGGIRASPPALAAMRRRLKADFARLFPAWADVEVTHFWAGLICLRPELTPYAGPIGDWPDAWAAFAYHGNGVAMGTHCGALLADLATGRKGARPFPALMRKPPRRFPFGRWRRILLPAAYAWYGLQDRGP